MSQDPGSNRGPLPYHGSALPTELSWLLSSTALSNSITKSAFFQLILCNTHTFIVAGTRFARMPTGYEPVEVLLLQPAINPYYTPSIPKIKILYYSS